MTVTTANNVAAIKVITKVVSSPPELAAIRDALLRAEAAAASLYQSITLGLANTVNGQYFKVPETDGDRLYLNDNGAAVDTGNIYPSLGGLTNAIDDALVTIQNEGLVQVGVVEAEGNRQVDRVLEAGSTLFNTYDNKQAFNEAVPNLTVGNYYQVLVDESLNNRHTLYKIIAGPAAEFKIYLDTVLPSNVAYIDQSNTFSASNSFTATNTFAKGQSYTPFTIPWSANIVIDGSESNIFDLVLEGDTNLDNITNMPDSHPITIRISQDSTGGHNLTFNSAVFKFPNGEVPTIVTTANSLNVLAGLAGPNGIVICNWLPDIS